MHVDMDAFGATRRRMDMDAHTDMQLDACGGMRDAYAHGCGERTVSTWPTISRGFCSVSACGSANETHHARERTARREGRSIAIAPPWTSPRSGKGVEGVGLGLGLGLTGLELEVRSLTADTSAAAAALASSHERRAAAALPVAVVLDNGGRPGPISSEGRVLNGSPTSEIISARGNFRSWGSGQR